MEEKNGRIVEIVESTEVQKQQKKNKRNLRIMIASLIVAGSVGYGAMNLSRGDSKEEQPAVTTEYQISPEFDGVEISNISTDKDGKTAEEAKSIPSLYAVVTSKDGKTTDTSYVLTADTNKVKLEENQRLVLIEKYDDEKEHPNCLFQKQTRDVSIGGENNLASSGEWQSTDEYVIGYSAPISSVDTRYIFTGTLSTVLENNPVIEMPSVVLNEKTKAVNSVSEAEYQISSEFDGVEISNISTDKDGKTAEEAKAIPSLYAVVTSKDGKTTDTSYVLTTDASNVKLEDNQRLVLVEHYTEDELNSSFLYQKEVRQVSMDDQGALLQAGEWQPTGDYDIRDDAPKNSVSTRYVFKGTLGMALENNSVIEMPTVVLSTETKTVNPILEDEIRWSNIFEDAYEWYSVNGQANTEAPNASLYADSYKKVGDSTGAPETTEAYAWNQGKIAGLRHLYENTQDASLLSKIDAELQRTDKLKNISDTLDREDAISTLMSMGDSEKEALEKIRAAEEQAVSGQSEKTNSELDSSTVGFTEYMAEKVQNKVNNFNEYAQSVTSQDVLTDGQISELNQQAQNTVKSIYDDQFNALHDYYETVQANQPSFPTLQSSDVDRQQFLDKANQKIFEMDQMLSDTNEQSVSEGKTR